MVSGSPRSNPDAQIPFSGLPPSKSILQRALLAAAWSGQETLLRFPAAVPSPGACGDDCARLVRWIEGMGWRIECESSLWRLRPGAAAREGGAWDELGAVEWTIGESATSARLLLGALSFVGRPGSLRTLSIGGTLPQRRSPALFQALERAGARFEFSAGSAWPSLIRSTQIPARLYLQNPSSSQEVSALLFALGFEGGGILEVQGTIPSRPYVALTRTVLRCFGVQIDPPTPARASFIVARRPLLGVEVPVEFDASAAAVMLAARILCGAQTHSSPEFGPEWDRVWPGPMQGDWQAKTWLEQLRLPGIAEAASGVGPASGFDLDLSDHPDLAPPLIAVAAALSVGWFGRPRSSRFTGLAALANKESSRLRGLAEALDRLGYRVDATADTLSLQGYPRESAPFTHPPGAPGSVPLDPRSDHRMAFAFALLRLTDPRIEVLEPGCVDKSWPGFWAFMGGLQGEVAGGDS